MLTVPQSELEPAAFLFSALSALSRARIVIANSGSNLGALLMTLAGSWPAEAPTTPHIIDLDRVLSAEALSQGRYFCNITHARAQGLCSPGHSRPRTVYKALSLGPGWVQKPKSKPKGPPGGGAAPGPVPIQL